MEEGAVSRLQDPGGGGGGPSDGVLRDDQQSGLDMDPRRIDDRRVTHNITEKRRKDRIKQWISHIAQLLPPNPENAGPDNRPSTLDIMERAAKYITQLKASFEELLTKQGTDILVDELKKMRNQIDEQQMELNQLRQDNEEVVQSNIQLEQHCRDHGIPVPEYLCKWKSHRKGDGSMASTSASAQEDSNVFADGSDPGSARKKNHRPGTVIAQLEQQRQQEQQQQQQQAYYQMSQQNGSVMSDQVLLSQSQISDSRPQTPNTSLPMGLEMISPSKGGPNILEAAIQSSGIKDSSHSPAPMDLGDGRSYDPHGHIDNLQTLASAASMACNTVASSSMSVPQSLASSNGMGYTLPYTTVTSSPSVNPIMSAGQFSSQNAHAVSSSQSNMMMGMNFVNSVSHNSLGQSNGLGQNPFAQNAQNFGMSVGGGGNGQQNYSGGGGGGGQNSVSNLLPGTLLMTQNNQMLIINENGTPVPYDPTTGTPLINTQQTMDKLVGCSSAMSLSTNSILGAQMSVMDQQQQALISSGALTLGKDHSGGSQGLASLSVSQPQASILSGLNSQMGGGLNFLGSQFLSQNPLGQLAVAQGNQSGALFQQQQFLQSLGMQFPGMMTGSAAGGVTNPASSQASQQAMAGGAGAGGFIFSANQPGGMLINTLPTSQNSMPTALVLPSGQVIPVVSNPQLVPNQQGGIMTASGAGGGQTTLQIPQLGGGHGGAGQMIQLDSSGNPTNPQFILGPNGLQLVPPAGQGTLTQQQLQQLLQQQNLGLLMPSMGVPQSSSLSTPNILTMATTSITTTKPPTVRATLAAAKASSGVTGSHTTTTTTGQQKTGNTGSHNRSHSASSTNRKSQPKTSASSTVSKVNLSQSGLTVNSSGVITSVTSSGVLSSAGLLTSGLKVNTSGGSVSGTGLTPTPGLNQMVLMLKQTDGQIAHVLLDSKTYQVLQSANSPAGQSLSFPAASTVSSSLSSSVSTPTSALTPATKKGGGGKKNSNAQRPLYPKPKSKSKAAAAAASVVSTLSVVTSAVSTPLMISTDAPWGHSTNGILSEGVGAMAEGQDILATAAASIFQTEDISPVLNCSPEADRLLIDDISPNDHHHHDNDGKKHKLTPVMGDRSKKGKQTQQEKLLDMQQQQQKQLESANLLQIRSSEANLQQTFASSLEGFGGVDHSMQQQYLQQQQQLAEEQRKLRQVIQEQSEIFNQLEGLNDHSPSISAATPVSVITSSLMTQVPPSMPIISPISEPSPAMAAIPPDQPTAATHITPPSAAAEVIAPAPTIPSAPAKKTKKSKKKKKEEEEERARLEEANNSVNLPPANLPVKFMTPVSTMEPIATSTPGATVSTEATPTTTKPPAKKNSRKRGKKGEAETATENAVSNADAAQKRREEIDRKQQQLLLEEQQKRKEEQQQLLRQQQHGDPLLLLQQQQQEQQQTVPSLMSDPQSIKMPSELEQQVPSSGINWSDHGDAITFNPNDLSAVLDTVENFDVVSFRTPATTGTTTTTTATTTSSKTTTATEKPSRRGKKAQQQQQQQQEKEAGEPVAKKARRCTSASTSVNTLSNSSCLFGGSPQAVSSDPLAIYDFKADSPPMSSAQTTKPEPKATKSRKGKGKAAAAAAAAAVSVSSVTSSVMSSVTSSVMSSVTSSSVMTSSVTSVMPSSPLMSPPDMSECVSIGLSVNPLDNLVSSPPPPPSKPSPNFDSLNTPKPCEITLNTPKPSSRASESKSKSKGKKKSKSASNAASSSSATVPTTSVAMTTAMVNGGVSDSLVTTMTSSKSNDSISTSDSVPVIMPSFDTLESLNSPAPSSLALISPPIASQKSADGAKSEPVLGQLSSVDSSEVSRNVIVGLPDDIGDITGSSSVEAALMSSATPPPPPPPPPVLHHHPQQQQQQLSGGGDSSTTGVSQMSQPKQSTPPDQTNQRLSQQQNSGTQAATNKPHQSSPRHTPLPQQQQQQPQTQHNNQPVLSNQQNQATAPPHAQMRPPTSPAQAVVRPRSAASTLGHQGGGYPSSSPQAGYPSTSPQAVGAMHQSPSAANCISPSAMSNHSRSSMDGFGGGGGGSHLTPSPSAARMTDMSNLLGSNDIPCPNANLFANNPQKMSRGQKPPTPQQQKSCAVEEPPRSHSRAGSIYSADNFLAPSGQSVDVRSQSAGGMGPMGMCSDAFSFSGAPMSMASTQSQNSIPDMGVAASSSAAPNSFSFSLTSAATTQTSASVANSGPYSSFYASQQGVASQLPHQAGMAMMNMPDLRMDTHSHQQQNTPGPMSSSAQQNAFSFPGMMPDLNSSCSVARESSCARETATMRQNVDKSPMGSFGHRSSSSANPSKHMTEIIPPQQQNKSAHSSSSSTGYFPSQNFPSSAASLNTSPLRHPPLPTSDSSAHMMNRTFDQGFGAAQGSSSVAGYGMAGYQKDLTQTRPLEHVSSGGSSSRKPASQQQQGGGTSKQKQSHSSSSNDMAGVAQAHTPSRAMNNSSHSSQRSNQPTPAHQTSGSGHAQTPATNQQNRSSSSSSAKRNQKSSSASSSSQSKKKAAYGGETDTNLAHNIFDSNQGLQSLFFSQNMSSPSPRNMQSEPAFLPTNYFGAGSRPLSTNSANKNPAELNPYSMLTQSRPQNGIGNGIGFNFQHGFSMQAMGNHSGGPMTPHSVAAVTPHMSNFALGNFLGDSGDSGLNFSPIKFPHHTNPILPPHQAGMDPNSMQVHQYHNARSHHGQSHLNAMALNSIFGQHPHSFDARQMSQGMTGGVGPPFQGGHPGSFMSPLNFSHDH